MQTPLAGHRMTGISLLNFTGQRSEIDYKEHVTSNGLALRLEDYENLKYVGQGSK